MKSVKNLLIPFVLMILLLIGSIVFFIYKKNTKPAETEDTLIDVLYVDNNTVKSITTQSSNADFKTVKITASQNTDGSLLYAYEGDDLDDTLSYSQEDMSSYVALLSSYSCEALISSEGNFAEYGLDNPVYTITLETFDGSKSVVYLGNKTPDSSYCYMRVDGSNDVYTVAVAKMIKAEYQGIDLLESQILDVDYSKIDTVEFDRTTDGLNIEATCEIYEETGDPQYFIHKPFNIQASAYFENLVEYVCTLEITSFMDISDDQLSQYGLDKPTFHFCITMDSGEKKDIYFSSDLGGYYYGYIAGMKNYFMVSDQQIKGLETPALTLLNSYISYYSACDISSIKGTYNGDSFDFELNVNDTAAISDDDSTVTINGRNAKIFNSDDRSYCAMLFESLVCIEIGGIESESSVSPDAIPVMTLTFVTNDYETTEYDFYQRDTDSYYVYVNGEYSQFYVYSRELFNDGGSDTYSYGVWPAYSMLLTAIDNSIDGIYDIPSDSGTDTDTTENTTESNVA